MHASLGGHLEIVKLLLAHSCVDVNMLSKVIIRYMILVSFAGVFLYC